MVVRMITLEEFVEQLNGRPFKRYKFLDAEVFEIPRTENQDRVLIIE